ncbi:DarT1-associated NADAR antitoxin family protein [Limoniibacter endophyticus]|uniref:Uncharacterized protein n=1 Tax=Limoniibacter endophyticus TaxID=1565040 RepID=A0A8J3DPM0_9HYPH|nr:hypothetical protein [Limoniibacter endophyticus]GHC64173.1 hypothetical protein GCM10010136_05980 [Limoniibacter endophyticus]
MAERPIFVPVPEQEGYVRQISFEIPWAGGFAESQKWKNITSLHAAAERAGYAPLLEISSKSDTRAGQKLSAFNLRVQSTFGELTLENAFQGSKVFARGGPFTDLYNVEPRQAKRDPRLQESGQLTSFTFDGYDFPLVPRTVFYDWLYLTAIFQHRDWIKERIDGRYQYAGFTDIEFNPAKSFNCQARSCALFVSLMREGKLEAYMHTPQTFIAAMKTNAASEPEQRHIAQARLRVG